MAKSFVSAGVFTNEIDASFLGPGVGAIGAALLGTSAKGPAHVPVTVTNFSEFTQFFGDLDPNHFMGYAARAYLKNAGVLNVVRVLGPSGRIVNGSEVTPGYSAETMQAITVATGSTGAVMALLEVTASHTLVVEDKGNDEFFISITGSTAGSEELAGFTGSFLTSSANYVRKILNTDPSEFESSGYYLRDTYDYAFKIMAGGNGTYSSASYSGMTNFEEPFNSGSTPWIKSQLFGGTSEYNIFRIHTLGHGESENGRFKVSIKNVKTATAPEVNEFGTFDLELRHFEDDDGSPVVEGFPNISLDPESPSYICRAIGDRYMRYDPSEDKMTVNGNYENRSRLIRVEITTGSFPDSALPWGFRGLDKPALSFTGSFPEVDDGVLDLPLVSDLLDKKTQSESSNRFYWGMETKLSGSVRSRLTKLPKMTGSDTDFSLSNVSGSSLSNLVYNSSNPGDNLKSPGDTTGDTVLAPAVAKFTVPVAFGFDGFDRRLSNPLDNETQLAAVTQLGTQALRQAVDIISDPDFIDINLLALPGIYSSKVVDYAIDSMDPVSDGRGDAFYIPDLTGSFGVTANGEPLVDGVNSTIQHVKGRGFDSNYAGVYYPGIKIFDPVNSSAIAVPPSVPVLGVMAYNDRVAFPWFAPAGLNRAGLGPDTIGFEVLNLCDQLKQGDRDALYENRINPIARFPDVPQGVIWGQKTLQRKQSALDRINVRRLLIRAKKVIASAVKFLVFEPNNATTQTRFRQLVNPILSEIQQKQGLEAFRVVMDETTNTPELVDRNILAGKIFLIPTRAAEFISIDFVISPSGASFDE